MFLFFVLSSLLIPLVFGGTLCPPRSEIYPCTCANVFPRKGQVVTLVTCVRLGDSDALEDIVPALRSIEIDQFHLYDSFWAAHLLGEAGEGKKGLPADWITLLKIKDIEIVDSTLSPCFACNWNLNCRNSVTTKFSVSNSTSTEKVCTLCESAKTRGVKSPWTGCMSKLKEFRFTYGRLSSLGNDLFPMPMAELTTLNMSYNQIVKIDPNAFRNLRALTHLDLSHNAIEFFDHMFGSNMTKLQILDVSWNFIKELSSDFFTNLPILKVVKFDNNMISELKRTDWVNAPKSLRTIDLSNNPLHCDCGVKWINATFHVSVGLSGTCVTPDDYTGTPVRRASRFLTQRCDASNHLGTRRPSTTKPTSADARRRRG